MARNPEEHVAVLYRTNAQSRQIEEALRRYGRKYIVVGGFSFYQRAEVKDVIAYLRVLLSPQDTISLLRIINTPARGIGRTTIEQIEQYALTHELALWTALERMLEERLFPARAEAALSAFQKMMKELADGIETRPPAETLNALLDQTGYRKMLMDEGTEESASRMANLDELLNAAADAAERGESLRDFLDHAALVSDADSVDDRAPVSLLTMHNAKGLEFPVVFIAGMEEGLFPHSRSINSGDALQMEEERRLCYVGMTRARKKLYLSWARYRRRFRRGTARGVDPIAVPQRSARDADRKRPRRPGARGSVRRAAPGPRNRPAEPLYWEDLQLSERDPAVFRGGRAETGCAAVQSGRTRCTSSTG